MKSALSLFAVAITATIGFGQTKKTDHTLSLDDPAKPGVGTLADCAWFAGYWAGPGLGGQCEELWLPPLAGSQEMMGNFRFVKDGKTVFTEHFLLVPEGTSLTLKLKHFGPDLKGWEAQDKCAEFKLVKVEKDAVFFAGLTMRKRADGIDVYVAITNRQTGAVREEKFAYQKAVLGK
jgi:hypothetical protein